MIADPRSLTQSEELRAAPTRTIESRGRMLRSRMNKGLYRVSCRAVEMLLKAASSSDCCNEAQGCIFSSKEKSCVGAKNGGGLEASWIEVGLISEKQRRKADEGV